MPGWWEDVAGQAEATLRDRAKAMIVTTGRKDLILEGCWILAGDAEWQEMRGGRIVRMLDSAQIHRVWDSAQIHDVGDSAQLGDSAKAHVVKS